MGCTSSKQKRCRHCKTPYSPKRQSYSMYVEHELSQRKSDSFHVVALTSSTLGSIRLDIAGLNGDLRECKVANSYGARGKSLKEQFSEGMLEAKAWSTTIEGKIPKTPIRTPTGEPEMIDARELMKGLEDLSPFQTPNHLRSLSLDNVRVPSPIRASVDDSTNFGFELDEVLLFKQDHPLDPPPLENQEALVQEEVDEKTPTIKKERVVVYFTSLRGVRKTYEDCCDTLVILKSVGARIDERDVSMHSVFKDELKELLGDRVLTGNLLPRVFVGKKYIGGAEEIRRMHEEGLLEKELDGCEMVEEGSGNGCCEACGNARFVPCETCSGSCKIYQEEEEYEDEEGDRDVYHGESRQEGEECGFQRCPDCNENGLVRCPLCCF